MRAGRPTFPAAPAAPVPRGTSRPPVPTYPPWRPAHRPPRTRRDRPRRSRAPPGRRPSPRRPAGPPARRPGRPWRPGWPCRPAPRARPPGSSLAYRDPGEPALADVLAVRADQPVIGVLLDHVGGPAGHPADREHAGEQVGRDLQVVVDGGGVEVHVRQQPLLRED